jgi:hypothetical protein
MSVRHHKNCLREHLLLHALQGTGDYVMSHGKTPSVCLPALVASVMSSGARMLEMPRNTP